MSDELGKLLSDEQLQPEQTELSDVLATTPIVQGHRRDLLAGQTAMIRGEPFNAAVLNMMDYSPDPSVDLQAATHDFYNMMHGKVRDMVRGVYDTQPNDLPAAVEMGQRATQELNNQQLGPLATEMAYVQQVAPVTQEDSLKKEYAARVALNSFLAEVLDEQSTGESILDLGSYFLPFSEAIDIGDIKEEFSKNPELASIAGDNIENTVARFQALPVERRQALIPVLFNAIKKATSTTLLPFTDIKTDGNITKAVAYMQQFFNVDGGGNLAMTAGIDVAFSAAGLIPAKQLKSLATMSRGQRVHIAGIIKKAADSTARETSAAHVAKGMGDKAKAADVLVASMTDEKIARSTGSTQHVSSLSAFPHQTQEWMKEVVDGVAPEISEKMNTIVRQAEGFARSIADDTDLLQLGAIGRTERKARVTRWFNEMDKVKSDYMNENIHLENLKVVAEDTKGFTYQYTLRNAGDAIEDVGGKPHYKVISGEVKWGIDDVTGTFTETINAPQAQSTFTNRVLSPAAWSTGDFNKQVHTAIVASDLTAANTDKVGRMFKWALEPVSGPRMVKARARLEKVLLAGDEYINKSTGVRGKVFSQEELAAGVNGVKLVAPAEVEAYYRIRLLADTFYQAQNQLVRRELELGKFQGVALRGGTDIQLGRKYESIDNAVSAIRGKLGYRAYDETVDAVVDLSEELVRAEYDKGKRLVRLRNDWNVTGQGKLAREGEFVEYVLVDDSMMRGLPEQVLLYRNGYVPKLNKAEYFVSLELPIQKGGVRGATKRQALHAFDSKADAEAFRQAQIAKYIQKHPEADRSAAERLFRLGDTNELNSIERLEEAVSGGNGLFTGTRSSDDIVFGLAGTPLERVSPLEAFQRNIQHLGKNLTRNELRIGEEKRWLNTVRKEMPEVEVRGFGNTELPNTPKGRALEAMRRTITEWNAVPEADETMFSAAIQYLHDWMLNGGRRYLGLRNKDSIHSLMWLKHASPFQAMKAANMHVMLGALNPAQIYVQGSAAAVALSRSGWKNLTGNVPLGDVRAAFRFSMLDNIRNETALGKTLKLLTKDGTISANEAAAYQAFRKTGLMEAIYNNADTAYMQGTGMGVTMRGVSKAENVSLTFYRAGEGFNRRFSFIKAFADHLEKGGSLTPDNDALRKIVERANSSMLELNSANRAWWQGGAGTGSIRQILGTSTQFLQVIAKTMELAVKGTGRGGWTNSEKARVLLGQVLLFGSAGIPLLNSAPGAVANWLGMQPNDDVTRLVNQGMVGTFVSQLFDADIDIGNRAAIGGQILTTMRDLFLSEEPLLIKAMGVSGETGSRFVDALKQLSPLMLGNRDSMEDLTLAQMKAAFTAIAEIPSSGRSMLKAIVMANTGRIYDRRGKPVTEDAYTFGTIVGAALGFRPSDETHTRMLQLGNREFEEAAQEAAEIRIKMLHKWIKVYDMDADYGKVVEHAIQLLDEGVDNEQLSARINEIVERRIYGEGDTLETKELNEFIERAAVDQLIDGYIVDRGLFDSTGEVGMFKPLPDSEED